MYLALPCSSLESYVGEDGPNTYETRGRQIKYLRRVGYGLGILVGIAVGLLVGCQDGDFVDGVDEGNAVGDGHASWQLQGHLDFSSSTSSAVKPTLLNTSHPIV